MTILKSQGTSLYFVDPDTNELFEVGCPTDISGLDVTNEQIETTCLRDQRRQYVGGLGTPSTVTFTLQFDPTDPSHLRLKELHTSAEKVMWAIGSGVGGGDIDLVPDVDTNGLISNPGGRVFWFFEGFIAGYSFAFALNTVVIASLTIQISGDVVLSPVTP